MKVLQKLCLHPWQRKKDISFPTNSFLLYIFPSTFLIGAVNLFLAWLRGLSYPRGEKCIIGTQSLCAYTYFRKKSGRAKTNNFASTHRFFQVPSLAFWSAAAPPPTRPSCRWERRLYFRYFPHKNNTLNSTQVVADVFNAPVYTIVSRIGRIYFYLLRSRQI